MKGARIVISASAFPASRGAHWNVLVRARAIENQIFVAAANRVGSEDLGKNGIVKFFGTSAIIDPSGETLIEGRADKEELLTAELDLRRIDEVRAAVDYLRDRRPDAYEIP
jgi:predicted amidohydrolase